jgi:spore cortex biosynthesis protein YabQ
MILSMSGQAWLFLSTVLAGAAIGFFFDVFRILRKTVPLLATPAAVQLEDFIFWVAVTGGTFYFMLNQNYGEIRIFSVVGAGAGIALYFASVSRFVIIIFVAVIEYLKKVFAAAFKIIFFPVRMAFKWIYPKLRLRDFKRYGKIRLKKYLRNWFILRKKV